MTRTPKSGTEPVSSVKHCQITCVKEPSIVPLLPLGRNAVGTKPTQPMMVLGTRAGADDRRAVDGEEHFRTKAVVERTPD
jgi:hypothetical protein